MLGADMSESTDTRDRVIKLESDLKHLTDSVESMSTKVTAMHDLLQQARGARWLILTAAALGGFVSAKLAAFMPWLSFTPR
jgi:hypothetical protein